MLFILNSVPEIREQDRNLSQSNYIPIPEPVTITYYFISAECAVRFGIRLPNIYIQKFSSKFGTFSEIDLRFNEMERIYQKLTFLVNYVNLFHLWLLTRVTRVKVTFFGVYSFLSLLVSDSNVRFSMS